MGVNVNLTKGATKAELDSVYAQAVIAKTEAETAKTGAETAETNAANSATASANSATGSATSATAAAASASAAAASEAGVDADRVAAETAATNAAGSASTATTQATTATTQASNAASSATSAAGSATTATTQATNAANSATTATTQATTATTQATNAATSATNAAASETNAATSASNAATSLASVQTVFDNFDDRYLGAKASDPTVDNDGNALLTGAVYWNTTSSGLRFYNGSAWEEPETIATNAATSATTSATAAATSATNAATSESNAAGSATTATTQASNASTSATTATTKASEAATSATNAANSATTAASYIPDNTGNSGKYLTNNGSVNSWDEMSISDVTNLQTTLDGKEPADATILKDADIGTSVLAPNGDGSQLTGIDALPSQTGHSGKYLGTDGTNASWNTLDTDANSTTKGLYEHSNTISSNYTIGTGNNAVSASPVTISSGVSVTVPTGSTWVLV